MYDRATALCGSFFMNVGEKPSILVAAIGMKGTGGRGRAISPLASPTPLIVWQFAPPFSYWRNEASRTFRELRDRAFV
mgnify:CR=1 FL=1